MASEIRTARVDYVCHDCSRPIHRGDRYFNRHNDFTVLCLDCWGKRKAKRETAPARDGESERMILELLHERPATSSELRRLVGNSYPRLIRRMKLRDVPIWKRRDGMGLVYHLGDSQSSHSSRAGVERARNTESAAEASSEKCRRCGDPIRVAGDESAGRRFCPECMAYLRSELLARAVHR